MTRRKIGVVTVSRSDYGIYRPLLQGIQAEADLDLMLFVGGMHLSPEFGLTVREIEQDGFPIAERVEMLLSSDTPESIAKAMGLGMIGFSQAFARSRPDILVVLGDRFEMFAAASAAVPFKIPLAHIHGGEITQGAMDEVFRHSITKMAHLHFAATSVYAHRIEQMGEEPWRVVISGALALDVIIQMTPMTKNEIEQSFDVCLTPPPLLVTFHPVTLEYEKTGLQTDALLVALREVDLPVIFTEPNADTGGSIIRQKIREFITSYEKAWLVINFGQRAYLSLLKHVAAMVGNSSSGLIEAPSFELPVVNVTSRQQGRLRALNVIDANCTRQGIVVAIQQATSTKFRESLRGLSNPYGDGHAVERIIAKLKSVTLDQRLLQKVFYNNGEQE